MTRNILSFKAIESFKNLPVKHFIIGLRNLINEMITGRVFEIPDGAIDKRPDGMTLKDVPMWDSPVIIAPRVAIPLR